MAYGKSFDFTEHESIRDESNDTIISLSSSGPLLVFGSSSRASAETVQFRLEATDLSGTPVSSVELGGPFVLNTYVEDVRATPLDVFSVYLDVSYDDQLGSVGGPLEFGPEYPNGRSANTTIAGILDDVGAFGGLRGAGGGEFLLFSLRFRADAVGQAVLAGGPATGPRYVVGVFGLNDVVPVGEIDFGTVSIRIVPEPSSLALAVFLAFVGLDVFSWTAPL